MQDISINVNILLECLFCIESIEVYFTAKIILPFNVNWTRNLASALSAVLVIFMLSKQFATLVSEIKLSKGGQIVGI